MSEPAGQELARTKPSDRGQAILPPPGKANTPRMLTLQERAADRPGALTGAILTLILGLALGLSNYGAGTTPMQLRFPALLAALLMVGQGVVDLRRILAPRPRLQPIPNPDPPVRGRELPAGSSPASNAVVTSVRPVKPTPGTLAVPLTVLILATWLGYEDLVTNHVPGDLGLFSVIASFALFALGWSLLPTRH